MTRRPERRSGCLPRLLSLFVLAAGVGIAAQLATNPWIFTLGGHARPWPVWQGEGTIAGPGGTYRIYLGFYPAIRRKAAVAVATVRGWGWVCAPAGQAYPVTVRGGTEAPVGRDANAVAFDLYTDGDKALAGIVASGPPPPRLDFTGRFEGPDLVMDDRGTLATAFLADGSLNPRPGPRQAARGIAFRERYWLIGNPCGKP